MRDGIELLADVYTPEGTVLGTLLNRCPYGYPTALASAMGGTYASRGYRVILARCRGTFGSAGTFEPMVNEVVDGADTVDWLRRQSWFEGSFGTFGGSYLGFTQWALLVDPPPELAAAVITVGPHDFRSAMYQDGAFNLIDFLGWSQMVSTQEDHGFMLQMVKFMGARKRVAEAAGELPLVSADRSLLGGRAPWYSDWVARRDMADPSWEPMVLYQALERVTVPILVQSGWHDLFLPQSLEQYQVLAERGSPVALTIGDWTHSQTLSKAGSILVPEALDWFGQHLAGRNADRIKAVKVFRTGSDSRWITMDSWPPEATEKILMPHPDGQLREQAAPAGATATFTYDPAGPTPTIGGRTLLGAGRTDDSSLAERPDVLSFTSAPLGTPLDVIGRVSVNCAQTSDNPFVDLFIRISEVDRRGRSRNICEGFSRLSPATSSGELTITLDATAHRFAQGNRIRLLVSGGSHPHWERQLGTELDPATSTACVPSHRSVDLSRSWVSLPVLASAQST